MATFSPSRKLREANSGLAGIFCTMEGRDMKTFIKLMRDDSGASAAEYALILAIVGTAIAVAAIFLGGTISNSMEKAANCINGATAANCT
jgi:pilus assembly protein Flp/PilA